jgi:hypothetical protein
MFFVFDSDALIARRLVRGSSAGFEMNVSLRSGYAEKETRRKRADVH